MRQPEGILTVAQAANLIGELLSALPILKIQGEVSGFGLSRGTFAFFNLKDSSGAAVIGCFAMARSLNFPLEDGMEIVVTSTVGFYVKNGSLRVTVTRVELVGLGNLQRAFELLKNKLEVEGLFAPGRKRVLPAIPQRVCIISSKDAAGFGDFMKIANTRLPGVQYRLYTGAVQGALAEAHIVNALARANSDAWGEVIALVRGGGSSEDLAVFSSEPVARAIASSRLPVITGIGHERDISIADLIADYRAPTPTAAAMTLLPSSEDILNETNRQLLVMRSVLTAALEVPYRRSQILIAATSSRIRSEIALIRQRTEYGVRQINHLSPDSVLRRGYTITRASGRVLRSKAEAAQETTFITTYFDGEITSNSSGI